MGKDKEKRLSCVAPHMSGEEKASLEVADFGGVKNPRNF